MLHDFSENAIDLIKRHEGFSPTAYYCPGNKLTIGYGHVLKNKLDRTITVDEANDLLNYDLISLEKQLNKLLTINKIQLNQNQYDAIISFVFNIGITKFKNSTLFKHLKNNDFLKAALEFNKWIYASGKIQQGLVKRREAEASLFIRF